MDIKFRKISYDDLEFILKLKELTLKWYIEIIYGWDVDIQRDKTKGELDRHKDDMRVIIVDDKDVGITTFYEEDGKYIVGLTMVHPDWQGMGIGTKVIGDYIDLARKDKKEILIKTYKLNRAKILYERLGFMQYREDNTHIYLSIDFKKEVL